MATTSIWKITKRLDHVVDYTTKNEKTENVAYGDLHKALEYTKASYKTEKKFYTTGINCSVDTALEEMLITKQYYSKTDGILGYHAFQSFKEGEVTPQIAHEIGIRLAEEIWGERFEVLVSTHLNTKHLHSHFVINSVSFKDGKRYYNNRENYALIRKISDDICNEYGISTIKEKVCGRHNIDYTKYYNQNESKNGYVSIAKTEIDRAIEMAKSYADFENILKQMDYEITYRAGKLSVCRPPYKRNIRIERAFGEEYSIANIKTRIANTDKPRVPFLCAERKIYRGYNLIKYKKPVGKLARLYLYYCYLLKIYPKVQHTKKVSNLLRKDVKKMDEYSKQIRFLCSKNINTPEELFLYKNSIEIEIKTLETLRDSLWNKYRYVKTNEERLEIKSKVTKETHAIGLLRREARLCFKIEENNPKIKENIEKLEEIQKRREKMKDDKFR
ncbi:MAG: relaxase/mobilization nuclease domain-containing protein [Oscillospiraceae bacterium]|nr:relaxase/mobilization nuclease domain-containing protein [Oscillospiraceae bacterium]